jgi:hypothetical protein
MSREAPRVHVDPAAIARLEDVSTQLAQDSRVEIRMDDGTTMRGIVTLTPTVQSFYDPDGNEGLNAVAKIEPEAGGNGHVWVDRISSVERLPNPSPPEASSRIHPPDPNAPATGG